MCVCVWVCVYVFVLVLVFSVRVYRRMMGIFICCSDDEGIDYNALCDVPGAIDI